MKVLITGAAEFIGGHLIKECLNRGEEAIGTFWKNDTDELVSDVKDKIQMVQCDVRDFEAVKKVVEETRPEKIFHLAAQSFPTVSIEKPQETIEINVNGTVNVFEAVRALKINPVVVVACSSAEYGIVEEKDQPTKETQPLKPLHPYGVSKVAQDFLAYQYFKNFGIKSVRCRIFNTTGPGKTGDVCADFSKRIVEVEKGLRKNISVGNLEAWRDFTDGRDMAAALWLASEKAEWGEVYNLCSGKIYKVGDLLEKMKNLSKRKIEIISDKSLFRPTDEKTIAGDNSKFISKTGWKPQVPIDKTLEDMIMRWREKL